MVSSPTSASGDITGSTPAVTAANPVAVNDEMIGSDPGDDLVLGKRHYREKNYGLAEQYFRRAVEKAPRDGEAWLDELFDESGHWREAPQAWANPEAALEQRRFWEAFEACLARLAPGAQRVFFKREVLGDETDAICKDEGITPSNCWVILHRSRLALRACLEKNWFGKEAA